jgi:cell division protein FtsQ
VKALVLKPPLRLWLRQAAVALNPSPRLRRRLLAALAALVVLLAFYMLWFRDSSFVAVQQVKVTGGRGSDAARVRAALTGVARDMTTLHVDRDKLQQAVAGFSSVRTLAVSADFPHTLSIRVLERRPVAVAVTDGGRVPVAGDGTVVRGIPLGGALPAVRISGSVHTDRLDQAAALRLVRVAGGAPVALVHRLTDVGVKRDKGIVAHVRHGPDLIFGDATRVEDKWLAAARVLADPSAKGATYIDVRLPERPAAGGLASAPQPEPDPPAATSAAPPSTPTAPQPGQATTTPAAPRQSPTATPQPQAAPVTPTPSTPGGGAQANPQP